MKLSLLSLCLAAGLGLSMTSAAQAQREADPNLRNFYMARQQVQILDDAPVVIDKRTNPQAAQQGGNGALPAGPVPLPKAGWQPYSSSVPSGMGSSLPKVVNGVPPKAPPQSALIPAKSGKAGAWKRPNAYAGPPKPAVKSYGSYQGYGGKPAVVQSSGGGAATYNSSSSTNVKGSVLHWSRTRRSGN